MGIDVLLVRRNGLTWAVKREDVLTINRHEGGEEVWLRSGRLPVETVVGVQGALAVHLPGPTLRRLLPLRCLGLAVVAGEPVAVLDGSFALTEASTLEGVSCHGR